jgi:acyl-coenzyme A thioesterase PaaI-like protein
MKLKVTSKLENSKMCFVCGLENPAGLRASLFQLDSGDLMAVYNARDEHQSYPGRLHGGICATLMDEVLGRTIVARSGGKCWSVTIELTTRFRKPIPTDRPVRVIGRIVSEGTRIFEGTAETILEDGSVAAESHGRYLKMPWESISDADRQSLEWKVVPSPDDPTEAELG